MAKAVEQVALVGISDGCELAVLRGPTGEVTITKSPAEQQLGGWTLASDQARALCDLLDRATSDDAPAELIGSVLTVDGRSLDVRRWPFAVSIGETFTMRVDQARELGLALLTAATDTNTQ
jgi:hypothetical protein